MSFQNVLGQEAAVRRLKGLIYSGRLPPALLFYGPQGVGKARVAVEFAKALNCTGEAEKPCGRCNSCISADKGIDVDLKRLNAVTQAMLLEEEPEKQQSIKIEAVRYLIKDLEMRSLAGRWKTAVVEEAHKMMPAAANALLKILEEPPPKTLWILITDQQEQLLPTILSRCHAVRFRPLPTVAVESALIQEGMNAQGAAYLAKMSNGSPGQAVELQKNPLPDPASWASDPLGPFRLAEDLPRELHVSRPLVESYLRQMTWHLRLTSGRNALLQSRVRRKFRELESLKRALKANAEPRLVLELAAMELASP